jgi:hypothetical protein
MAVTKKILDLKAGSQVRIGVEHGRVVFEPQTKPGYTLAELLVLWHPHIPLKQIPDQAGLYAGGIACEVLSESAQALPRRA